MLTRPAALLEEPNLRDFASNSCDRFETSDLIELQTNVSEFDAIFAVVRRDQIRGLPGGVHGVEAEVSVDRGPLGSRIAIRAGALALYTVMSFAPDGNLKSVGAFEDLEPESVLRKIR
jgi:hypothetical protein